MVVILDTSVTLHKSSFVPSEFQTHQVFVTVMVNVAHREMYKVLSSLEKKYIYICILDTLYLKLWSVDKVSVLRNIMELE